MYNLRPRNVIINYDEDAYFDSIGVEEMIVHNKFDNQVEKEKYKLRLISSLRMFLHAAYNAPDTIRHIYAMECITASMEYIRNIGDSENFKQVIKNKIQEFMKEPKMATYKNKLKKYFTELDNMMEIDG